jgi:resuscitation-promoting factor RpfE
VHTLKKTGLAAACLVLSLALLAGVGSGPAVAEGDDGTTTTTVPPSTTEAPSTTTSTTTSTTSTTVPPSTATEAQPAQPAESGTTWGPDPRWVDYGNCGAGITACHVAKAHQRRGLFQWRNGRWFQWGTSWVRGTPGETWSAYRHEAARIRLYLYLLLVSLHRAQLVSNWSGVASCETGGNWSTVTGNGYYGGLQFSLGTWSAYGGSGMPNQQPAWYQATIADRVRVQSGLSQWPVCGSHYG